MSERSPMHLRVFVGSPGDTGGAEGYERALTTRVLERLPRHRLLRGKVTVEVVSSDGVPMHAGDTPQRSMPRPSSCDLVVIIFRARMGTPVPADYKTKPDGSPYRSGTEYEYWEALDGAKERGKPHVLVYRWGGTPEFDAADPAVAEKRTQWAKLEAFFGEFRNPDGSQKRSFGTYVDRRSLRRLLTDHMYHRLRLMIDARDQGSVVVAEEAQDLSLSDAQRALRAAVAGEAAPAVLSPRTVDEVSRSSPHTEEQYRLQRIAQWSKPEHQMDKRFVRLTLLVDRGESAAVRWEGTREFGDLRDVLAELSDPALVLLGVPGSGKSTMLRRLELDAAVASLRTESDALTFFVPLNRYRARERGGSPPPPLEWLAEEWAERFPHLSSLDDLLRNGRMTLLLDALNEMPRAAGDDYRDRVELWREFLVDLVERRPGNRVLFTCRKIDYSAPLSSPALRVPQVRLKALTPEQAHEFVRLHVPEHAEQVWAKLIGASGASKTPQLDLFSVPFFLKLLVDEVAATGRVPHGRAGLLAGLVRRALRREVECDSPLFRSDDLLDERDRLKVTQDTWKDAHDLPERGALIPRLVVLADGMQRQRAEGEGSQVRVKHDEALALVDHGRAADILNAGVALGVLDEDLAREEVQFFHQLLQEFFAARGQVSRLEPVLARSPWRKSDMKPALPDVLARLADSDPLPPPPATGWEGTMLLAAAMVGNPDAFVRDLAKVNLPLAANCAAEAAVEVSEESKAQLRRDLIDRTSDPAADLRARIE